LKKKKTVVKDNSFSGSSRRSEDKVIYEEGRKLITFYENINLGNIE
jgi:hypothetical protein